MDIVPGLEEATRYGWLYIVCESVSNKYPAILSTVFPQLGQRSSNSITKLVIPLLRGRRR